MGGRSGHGWHRGTARGVGCPSVTERSPDTKRPGSPGRGAADGAARPELKVLWANEDDLYGTPPSRRPRYAEKAFFGARTLGAGGKSSLESSKGVIDPGGG